jgi:hypothetical protein
MRSALLVLINLESAARIAVLWRCLASGVLKRHACFCALTVLSCVGSILASTGSLHPYREFWLATQWPIAALQAGAAIEAFWGLARHFRGIRNFAWALLGVILTVTGAAAASVSFLRARWDSPFEAPLLLDQFTGLWLVLTALLSLAFFKQFPKVPVRPNAIRHLAALSILFGANFIAYSMGQLSRGQWRFQTNFVIYCGAILANGWWALTINRDGERLPFAPPPPMTSQEFDAAEAAHRQSARELKQAGSEALRRTFRS